jgi:hypothetical protein
MRKLFLAIMSVSALAVLLGGVAVAWSTTASAGYTSSAGSLNVGIYNAAYTGQQVYPTGNWIPVVTGEVINNTTANPGIAVQVAGGTVTGISQCDGANLIVGQVLTTNNSWVAPGGYAGGGWEADLAMPAAASNSCQGFGINYTVNVNVQTP